VAGVGAERPRAAELNVSTQALDGIPRGTGPDLPAMASVRPRLARHPAAVHSVPVIQAAAPLGRDSPAAFIDVRSPTTKSFHAA